MTLNEIQRWKAEYELAANGDDRGHGPEIRALAKRATDLGLPGLLSMIELLELAERAQDELDDYQARLKRKLL
jgi:hypothetical protein